MVVKLRAYVLWLFISRKELFSEQFTIEKLQYIHNNPVVAGIVDRAEDYVYSSARDYYEGKNAGLLEIEFL